MRWWTCFSAIAPTQVGGLRLSPSPPCTAARGTADQIYLGKKWQRVRESNPCTSLERAYAFPGVWFAVTGLLPDLDMPRPAPRTALELHGVENDYADAVRPCEESRRVCHHPLS